MYDNTSEYKEIYNNHDLKFYEPTGDYHISRYVAAGSQNVYSASGATKDYLKALITAVQTICNDENTRNTWRTDIGTLMNNLQYRLQYPVDEDCAIRMGAIYALQEGEDPAIINPKLIEDKVKLARKHPDLYTFFLTLGVVRTPSWTDTERNSATTQYFQERQAALSNLMPYNQSKD